MNHFMPDSATRIRETLVTIRTLVRFLLGGISFMARLGIMSEITLLKVLTFLGRGQLVDTPYPFWLVSGVMFYDCLT